MGKRYKETGIRRFFVPGLIRITKKLKGKQVKWLKGIHILAAGIC